MEATDISGPEELFSYVLKGHKDAVAFLSVLFHVFHVWDDLIDKDKPLHDDQISDAFFMALVVLPRNRFYQDHFAELNALVDSAITNWRAANSMERTESDDDKRIAFITRSNYCNVAITAARIVGGHQWAVEVAPLMRRYWHREGYDQYLKNLAAERAIQGAQDVLQ